MYKSIVTVAFLSGFFCTSRAQNDTTGVPLKEDTTTTTASDLSLLDELDALDKPAPQATTASKKKNRKEIVYNAFGGTHLINGQTTETINKKTMAFIIAHRFGRQTVAGGVYSDWTRRRCGCLSSMAYWIT